MQAAAIRCSVSPATARRALQLLCMRGLLVRAGNGRLTRPGSGPGRSPTIIAFLAPSAPSPDVARWREALDRVAAARSAVVATTLYAGWDDSALALALTGQGAVALVLYPGGGDPPDAVLRMMHGLGRRLVIADQDWSGLGFASLCPWSMAATEALLDHCREAGYAAVACLNAQRADAAVRLRLMAWRTWCARHGLPARLLRAERGGGDQADRARIATAAAIADGDLPAGTALFATTAMSAIGVLRALYEAGLPAGERLGVCTLNDAGLGAHLVPSLTSLAAPDLMRMLRHAIDAAIGASPAAPMPFQPVVVGRESTRLRR